VYFGTTSPPPQVVTGLSDTTHDPGTMEYEQMYYWQIISWDNHGASTSGPIWSFTTGSEPNSPPYAPSSPNPVDGGLNIDIDADLSWIGGDPDGNPVLYDVYFGTMSPPPILNNNQSDTSYDPGTLTYDTMYYWMIVAWDDQGANTVGPEWSFTTEENVTHMGIIPSSDTVNVGENFTATIYIDPVEPIGGWGLWQLNFTQGKANATEITAGIEWASFFDAGEIDNDNGTIVDVQSWTIGPYPDYNHTACTISFTALEPGEFVIEIISVEVTNDLFQNIPVVTHNATITITIA
jgi:hypothetical protein